MFYVDKKKMFYTYGLVTQAFVSLWFVFEEHNV